MIHNNDYMTHPGESDSQIPEKKPIRFSETAAKINNVLERMMPVLTPAGIAMGIIFTSFYLNLRPYIPWLFGAITLAGALKLRARDLLQAVKNPFPIIIFFFNAHIVMPLLTMFLAGLVFGNDPDTISGYVLIYSVPTAVSGFIWVSIYRGDPALSLALILIDTFFAPLIVPGTVRLLLGTKVSLDITGMAVSLIFMVVAPTIIGITVNEASRGKIPKLICPYFTPFSKILLFLVISANCAPIASQINLQNPRIWIIGIVCICFTFIGFTCGKIAGMIGRRFGLLGNSGREKQISLLFASGLRNISAAMTLGIEYFPAPAALPTVLGIVFQQSIAAIVGKIYIGKESADREKE